MCPRTMASNLETKMCVDVVNTNQSSAEFETPEKVKLLKSKVIKKKFPSTALCTCPY